MPSSSDTAERDFSQQLRDVNEALLVSSLHEHDLAETLRQNEALFSALIEQAPVGVYVVDAALRLQQVNPRALPVFSHVDPLLGRDFSEVIHILWPPPVAGEIMERFRHTLQTGERYISPQFSQTRHDIGVEQSYEWQIQRVTLPAGQHGVVCYFSDITERKAAEDALRKSENKTMEQAKSLADLHRRKDEFLAMLSHELRNPLAPILNAVQLLRLQKDGTPIQREAHGMIERQVGQLARLVDDLLEVSRISTGRIHLQEEHLDLRGIVHRAIETTCPEAGQKGHSVAASLPEGPVWIYGDPLRLEQVVVNLLNNSSKYTDRGGHIWVGLEQAGDEAVLRVRDNGIGIAPEVIPRVFDLFTQADKSLDRSQGGLGIGLALVQSLVTMHRGRVTAVSKLGQGSEFIVRLPIHVSAEVASDIPVPIIAPVSRPLKVLVVDDNMDGAKGMAMLLRAGGHDARVAHDGASALQAALEYGPHVVLLDIGLPVMNGYDVARGIRRQPALKNVVLVALTGYGHESDKQRSQEAGFDHHLVKPVDFAKVEQILAAVSETASR